METSSIRRGRKDIDGDNPANRLDRLEKELKINNKNLESKIWHLTIDLENAKRDRAILEKENQELKKRLDNV